jgi:hypothetical protein
VYLTHLSLKPRGAGVGSVMVYIYALVTQQDPVDVCLTHLSLKPCRAGVGTMMVCILQRTMMLSLSL